MTLKEQRISVGKSISETAERLGVTERAYLRYEQGTRRMSFEQVFNLSQFFNITVEEIMRAQLNVRKA